MQLSDLQRIVGINHPHDVEGKSYDELLDMAMDVSISQAAQVTSPETVEELVAELKAKLL